MSCHGCWTLNNCLIMDYHHSGYNTRTSTINILGTLHEVGIRPWYHGHFNACPWNNSFWNIHFNKWNIPKCSLFSFTIFSDLEEIIFEIFNISENNIIIVKLAKVLRYIYIYIHIHAQSNNQNGLCCIKHIHNIGIHECWLVLSS